MVNNRAQAALEFLTTYGWAFLVILVMIGALSYFGVFSPDSYVPDSSNFGAGQVRGGDSFSLSHISGDDSVLELEFINDKNDNIVLDSVMIKEASQLDSEFVQGTVVGSTTIPGGFNGVIEVGFDESLTEDIVNEKKKFDIEIYYTVAGSSIPSLVKGSITTTVQEEEPSAPELPTVTIAGKSDAQEPAKNGVFTITLSKIATEAVTINLKVDEISTADWLSGTPSCEPNDDYYLESADSVLIGIGENSVDLTVFVCDDGMPEATETVFINLLTGDGYELGDPITDFIYVLDPFSP